MIFFKYGNKFDKRRKFSNNVQNLTTCTHKNNYRSKRARCERVIYLVLLKLSLYLHIISRLLLLSKDFFEKKNILIENIAHFMSKYPSPPQKKNPFEISEEITSLEPMIERLAIKDNRCSINYQSDLPYILKN